jgi:hypothetical protein
MQRVRKVKFPNANRYSPQAYVPGDQIIINKIKFINFTARNEAYKHQKHYAIASADPITL